MVTTALHMDNSRHIDLAPIKTIHLFFTVNNIR